MKNLQRIRLEKGISQNELVLMSGINRTSITKYESGEKNINKAAAETVYKLSCSLECAMEDLIEK